MTCYRSRDNWHSYVKNSLSEAELNEITDHLKLCFECQNTVSLIQETAGILAKSRVDLSPPSTIKINVMMGIDKNRYKENLAGAEPQARNCANSSHHLELKNWGLSMVAAGLLLFTLNLTSLPPNFKISHVAELNSELGKQIALPFDKMSQITHDALGKIESLTLYQPK